MNDPREEGTFTPIYRCPECGETFTDPTELKWIHFTDGEVRKQCIYCPFYSDEVEEYRRDIEEIDFDN